VSPTRSRPSRRRGRYHHGDLREALIDAALELIAERGVHGFSLAEATRRLGVTTAAPYRHFADRDDVLAAVAVRALQTFAALLADDAREADTPEQRLAAMARTYVRFAAEHRPMFETLLRSGIDKRRYPALRRAYEPVDSLFLRLVQEICQDDPAKANVLASVLEATAHGHAVLLLGGEYGDQAGATTLAADQAASATLAVILGREALQPP
jgi:AcrR family transcriptional regulator